MTLIVTFHKNIFDSITQNKFCLAENEGNMHAEMEGFSDDNDDFYLNIQMPNGKVFTQV